MRRPKESYYTKSLLLRMPPELHELLKEQAYLSDIPMNQIILELVAENLSIMKSNFPDWSEKMERARFIIKNGLTPEEWQERLIRAGYLRKNADGTLTVTGHGVVPSPGELDS